MRSAHLAPPVFEARVHAPVERLVMVYSRLDVNLALFVANWRGHLRREQTLRDLEIESFKGKLNLVMPAVMREYGQCLECISKLDDWLIQANHLRCSRNELMHGRWGIYELHGTVCNIVGLLGPRQREVTYALDELASEVDMALTVYDRFIELSQKWPA